MITRAARQQRHRRPVGIISEHLAHGQRRRQRANLDATEERIDNHPRIAAGIEERERDVAMRGIEPALRQSPPPRAAWPCRAPDQEVVDRRQGE